MCADWMRWRLVALVLSSLAWFAPRAQANVTVLLEEPYSYDGAFAGTGHTAVYLDRVCAATPVTLRRCAPDERGVVISRYARIAGYDWIAIPIVPYLYAVETPEDVPLIRLSLSTPRSGEHWPLIRRVAQLPDGPHVAG